MPIQVNSAIYYRTAECCRLAGITKNTFLRWVKNGNISDVIHRDRRGWRLFSEEEKERLKFEANKIRVSSNIRAVGEIKGA